MGKDNGNRVSVAPPPKEMEVIDSAWDDDASGEIPLGTLEEPSTRADAYDRVTAVPEMPSEEYVREAMASAESRHDPDEKSGVQPKEERKAARTTANRGLELDLPPLVLPDPPAHRDELELVIDEPGAHADRRTYDDLSLELDSPSAQEPMLTLAREPPPLELTLETPLAPEVEDPAIAQMRDRYAAGDFTGALVIAESLLDTDPGHDEASRYAQSCRDVLTQMYAARVGSLDQVISVAIPPDQVRWLSLDHRAGFLLSLVDGTSTIDEVLDISGMSRLDALRIVYTLLEQRVISLSTR